MTEKALSAIIHGIVQGVGFRYHTRETALELGLTGTVRNLHSGQVEVFAEGKEKCLESLKKWLQHGPASAQVSQIELTWKTATGNFNSFNIIE